MRIHNHYCIGVMTRLPRPGTTKTRLIPALGEVGAAALQRDMALHVVRQCHMAARIGVRDTVSAAPLGASATAGPLRRGSVRIHVAGGGVSEVHRWLKTESVPQVGGDLGQRIAAVLRDGLDRAQIAIAIGSDCPSVDAADLLDLIAAALRSEVAFIAAEDGGYCAVAVARSAVALIAPLTEGHDWGTESVLATSVDALRRAGAKPEVVATRFDVDRAEDVDRWQQLNNDWTDRPRTLSVVIPALNEGARIAGAVSAALDGGDPAVREVIVVDGGSADDTVAAARAAGATVISTEPGRGHQMNVGGAASTGDALLFLHADSWLEPGYARVVLDALADPTALIGAFRFTLDERTPALAVVQALTRLRGTILRMPYGDQGMFCRRVTWRALGTFPEWPVMEDYEIVNRAHRAEGFQSVRIVATPLVTSARRWREYGVVRWALLNAQSVAIFEETGDLGRIAALRRACTPRYSKR